MVMQGDGEGHGQGDDEGQDQGDNDGRFQSLQYIYNEYSDAW